MFDHILLLARGKCIYDGEGGPAAAQYFASKGHPCPDGYNVADHLLEIASDAPPNNNEKGQESGGSRSLEEEEKRDGSSNGALQTDDVAHPVLPKTGSRSRLRLSRNDTYATTFLTQLQVLSKREWTILKRSVGLIIA